MKRAAIRLPSEIVERLDRLTAKLRAVHPAECVSRAAVVRALLSSSLTAAERAWASSSTWPERSALRCTGRADACHADSHEVASPLIRRSEG